MRFLMGLFMMFTLTASLFAAPDYRSEFKELMRKGAEQSRSYWQGDHFGDAPWTDADTVLKGRSSHDFAMIYWNFMDAKLNGNQESLSHSLNHYKAMTARFWNPEIKLYNTDYNFLMNTSIAMTLALSLRDAGDVIPAEVQADIREKLAGIALYLPTYNTALIKTTQDLRANNQDSFASFALALIAAENKDAKVRQDALQKFRTVLDKTQQSFWIEGGVDVGYQSVGEAAFAAAADLLWDDLTHTERKMVSDLGWNNRIGNGFGLENARSSSWIRQGGDTFSSGLLGRVPNAAVAADAANLFTRTREKGFPTRWWLHDPASLSFFSGFWKNADAIAAIVPMSQRFSIGSLACQMMRRDEQQGWYTGMEKAYLTGDGDGATAIFGDYSRFNPAQTQSKFASEQPPYTPNPGGLRYLGYKEHLYVIPDDQLGMPRLGSGDSFRYPQLYDRTQISGPAASEYLLTQILPGMNGAAPIRVDQTFVIAENVLIALFHSPDSLKNLTYGVTMPADKADLSGNRMKITQSALDGKGKRTLGLTAYGLTLQLESDRWRPYFKDEIALGQNKIKLPSQLRQVTGTFTGEAYGALVLSPENRASEVNVSEEGGVVRISFLLGERRYEGVCVFTSVSEVTFRGFTVTNPRIGYLQLATLDKDGKLNGFAASGTGFADSSGAFFSAQSDVSVSMLRVNGTPVLWVTGAASISSRFGETGVSWVDGRSISFPADLEDDRVQF